MRRGRNHVLHLKGHHTLDKSISKAKRPEFACVYSVSKMTATLERNAVFHMTVKNINEGLVKIARKMARPLEFIGMAEEKYPSKKVPGFFRETFAKNQGNQVPRRNLEHLARRWGKP